MTNTCFSCGDHVVICKGFLGVLMAVCGKKERKKNLSQVGGSLRAC